MIQRYVAAAALLCAGCVALSPGERNQLERLENHGCTVKEPPPGFVPPVKEWMAAGLNLLPGIGNFYLASKGGGDWQWALGVGNLLLWPISPAWAVAQGGIDARTLNKRALLEHCRQMSREGKKLPSRAGKGNPAEKSPAEKTPATETPKAAAYEIATEEPFEGGRAAYRVRIRDASMTAFDVVRVVKPEIETVLRDAFAAESPGIDVRTVRAYVVPEFGEDRTIRFRGVAFSVQPVTDGWRYDADSHRGSIRLRVSEGMTPEEAKRWARDNIEAIAREKNVSLEAGGAPPEGAVYRSLGETLEDGVLTVEFEAVE